MDMPSTGGSWIRDPKTGTLARNDDRAPVIATVETGGSEATPAEPVEPTAADESAEPRRKSK